MQPCWCWQRAEQISAAVPQGRIQEIQSRKNSVRGYISTDKIFKKSQQEFLNEKGGSTAPSGFPLLNRRRHVKKVNRISWGSSALLHAELTYGSVSKWCITKADTWLSQIGPDSQSRQLGDSLQRKFLHGTFFFMVYFPIEGGMWL